MTTRIMSKSISSAGAGGSGLGGIPSNSRAPPTATTTTTVAAATSATTSTTTITSDPGILCFHHCNVKVFCFTLPHICPQCKTALDTHPSSGLTNKRHKSKKRTSATNNAQTATTTKGHYGHRHGHDVNNANKRDNHDDDDDDQWHNGNDQQHQATMDQDNDDKDDDEDDNDSDDEENSNDSICRIMDSRLLPFRLPYPFVRANQYPCAIVLRPTTGDFLNDYNNTTDLHIAVTTSTGCVVEFDRHGLRRHRTANMSDWWQCLLVGDVPEPWYDYWDQVLFEVCQQPDKWTVSHYHEDKHNCYTFVLTFLQALTYDKLSEAASSKTTFCEKYIVPRTTTAGKYISLYRKLRDTGIYVHHTNHNKLRYGGGGGGGAGAGVGSSSSRSKMGKHHQQHYQQQEHKFNNSGITSSQIATPTTTKSSMLSSSKHQMQQQQQHQQHPTQNQNHQQQQQHQHHHNSIISRPHSKLCTIEE
ncbi:uncharacterized protein LOC101900797 [Musca domestica]|uniref:Uncharacterized protein LOC101900797 n=1 Tax=Musca domestica TaxID=7370 RepID=A0A1I8MCK5_MUSDO|nr:uncharacterized protein LOC101900797 [Musca domestica]